MPKYSSSSSFNDRRDFIEEESSSFSLIIFALRLTGLIKLWNGLSSARASEQTVIVEARFMVTKDFNFSPPRDLLSNDTFLCVRLDGWMDGAFRVGGT